MKKNYVRLIGSLIVVLGMVMTIALNTIRTEANDTGVEYKEIQYIADNTVPVTPEGLENYLFAGWYTNSGTEETPVYNIVSEPIINETYYAKYVPAGVLGIKAQVSENVLKDVNTDATELNAIRFVTSLDSTNYKKIGFNIKIGSNYNVDVETTKYVYKTIYAIGAKEGDAALTFTPQETFNAASDYFKTYTFTDVPKEAFNQDITVTPYWITVDGTRVDGMTAIRTANYCRAWYYVDSVNTATNTNAPKGTNSNPYTTLTDAIAMNSKNIAPKIILKSDLELSTGVELNKTMTLTSENDNSIIRMSDMTDVRMLTVKATNGTVTLGDITVDGDAKGACIQISAGTLLMDEGSTIQNGKITASHTAGNPASAGANVFVSSGTNLEMRDGSLVTGGNVIRHGGNILVQGTFTMRGGTVSDGKAVSSTSTSNYGCGGNIHSYGAGTINLIDGTISGGLASNSVNVTSTGNGGNICSAGTINIDGGIICDGRAITTSSSITTSPIGCGGNIFSTGKVYVSGGVIRGGSATSAGYNVTATNGSLLTINEGTIEGIAQDGNAINGGVQIATSAQDVVLGSGVININGLDGGLYLESGRNIVVSDVLNENTKINVQVDTNRIFMTGATENNLTNFVSSIEGINLFYDEAEQTLYTSASTGENIVIDLENVNLGTKVSEDVVQVVDRKRYSTFNDDGKKLMFKSDGIYVVSADAHVHCLCGDTSLITGPCAEAGHYEVEYAKMASTTSLAKSGNYYLTDDLNYEQSARQIPVANSKINVCLNGHSFQLTDDQRLMQIGNDGIEVSFTGKCRYGSGDTKGSIVGKTTNANAYTTGLFFLSKSSLNLYNLTLNVKDWKMGERTAGAGAGITIYGSAKLFTYGSTIIPADTFGLVKEANKGTANRGVYAYGECEWTNPGGLIGNPKNGEEKAE